MTQRTPLNGQGTKKAKRRIQIYRAHVGTFDSGKLVPIDPAQWQMETNRLGYGEEAPSRYMSIADDDLLWVRWRKSSGYPAMQFCRTRKSALPQKERKGRVSELGIRPDEGLVEQMHIVFFPDNLVGSEYNHFGPKMSQLAPYLKAKMGSPSVRFDPLIRGDVAEIAERLLDLRVLELDIDRSVVERVRSANDSLARAFEANLALVTGQSRVSLSLKFEAADRENAL